MKTQTVTQLLGVGLVTGILIFGWHIRAADAPCDPDSKVDQPDNNDGNPPPFDTPAGIFTDTSKCGRSTLTGACVDPPEPPGAKGCLVATQDATLGFTYTICVSKEGYPLPLGGCDPDAGQENRRIREGNCGGGGDLGGTEPCECEQLGTFVVQPNAPSAAACTP
jgi:hypothetical protein